jgi:drug/metabolite transporter (DMT)-like permease
MNKILLILIFIISIFGFIRSILKKKRININNKWTIISIDSILITTLILIMSYHIIGPEEMIKDVKNFNFDTWVLTISISVLIVISVFSRYYLLDNYEISKFKPILIALRTIFIVIMGYLIFDEKITRNKIIGCLFILLGIYFISY